ncbi:MAG: hypothetical protein QOG02_338 [Gaiellales bacterium]|jgi:uncharacterized protein YcnI|nr:hypothetical protein [Gaiellales bacterium]MDX6544564.1 hypothetical protein [Gaiellales bacterium]
MRHRSRNCAVAVMVAAFVTPLIAAAPAWAHAALSPPVAETGVLQQFTLAVPTEKEGATTNEIELTVPDGVGIDSFEAAPGWTRKVSATGAGEEAIVNTVTWTGGSVPTGEDAVFHFSASITGGAKTYTFTVRQTYSDGSVVDWNGSESSDIPSPTIVAVSSLGGGSSSTLAIIALVVAAIGVLVAFVALLGGRRSLT